ncbi:hypothetical protein D3C73_1565590 [compost metagenome]
MHHDHARALTFDGVVVGVVTDQPGAVATLVRNLLGLDGGLGQPADDQQEESKEHAHGQNSCRKIIETAG